MTSVQKPIPPPKNLRTLSKPPTSMPAIRKAMGAKSWSDQRFKEFRTFVRATAERLKLDTHASSEKQHPTKWKKFDELIVDKYPDIQDYQNNWPLALYYNHWVSGHLKYLANKDKPAKAQSAKARSNSDSDSDSDSEVPLSASLGRTAPSSKRTAAANSDDDSEDQPVKKPRNSLPTPNNAPPTLRRSAFPPRSQNVPSKRGANDNDFNTSSEKTRYFLAMSNRTRASSDGMTRYYVGRDPSNFSRPPTSDSSKASSPRKTPARPVLPSDDSDTDDPLGSGPPTGKSTRESSQRSLQASQSASPQPTDKSPAVSALFPPHHVRPLICVRTQTHHALTDWPVWCVWCQLDTPPAISEPYTIELRQLFPAPSDIPRILAAIGILHDMHLRVFALRSRAERNIFLRSFIGSQYDQLTALQISKTIDQYAAEHAHETLPDRDMEVQCSYHQHEHQVHVPSDLSDVLYDLGMEELGPAAVFLGCIDNVRFKEAREYDEATKKEFLLDNVQIIKPSPFQKLMLQIALKSESY
ncbi:hypothetical protein MSAN_01022600 [Mycena sanguinolenta]|uniref:Uncharacterized protein n=1 Tax=Mycena sanguinolenta TaxID=230812 RepID=A0A8H7D632_9AGAR|nr:hypothetical protein MSAN_01022600 [Mycena sanguinolenta]